MSEGNRCRNGLFLLGICLALGMVATAFIGATTYKEVRRAGNRISVKGFAEQRIVSDIAVWRGEVSAQSADLSAAYTRLQNDIERVRAKMGDLGVTGEALSFTPVRNSPQYEYSSNGQMTGRVLYYRLSAGYTVEGVDVKTVAEASRSVTDLIKDGVSINSYPPEYYVSNLEDTKIRLLGEATANARERAEQFAKGGGVAVGELTSARQGVFQITPVNSVDVAGYGRYDTSTIQKNIRAVVTVEFAIH